MDKLNAIEKDKSIDKFRADSWLSAISEAQRQIASHRLRIKQLQRAISTFRKNSRRGEPWPEKSETQN
jgi:hypothetical protein